MAVAITSEDIRLIRQPSVECYVRINILNDNDTVLDSLEGIISDGTVSIDANSDIRRTCNFTIIPTRKQEILVNETSYIWLNRKIKMEVGIKNLRTNEIKYYSQGHFIYTETSGTYDANTNTLQVNCADFMAFLDGSRNGTLGQLQTIIPAYKEDSNTGEVLEYNYIRDAIIKTITQLGRITDIQIDEVGEYKGIESRNEGYCQKDTSITPSENSILVDEVNYKVISQLVDDIAIGDYVIATGYALYRIKNLTWNCIPYDLEFSAGDSILTILTTLRDLYPNYEMFFDINNIFICQMKPSGYDDDIVLSNDYLQQLLISENTETTSSSFSEVKNISEVWGETIEADFYTETGVTYVDNVYIVPNSAYIPTGEDARYYNGDIVAFNVPITNLNSPSINIENLGAIPIYDGENLNTLKAGVLVEGRTYSFKIKRTYDGESYDNRAIYLGQYQPHAMTVLLNSDHHDEQVVTPTGETVEIYSPEYFYELYDVSPSALTRTINEDSPYAIEKIGSILQVEQKESCVSDDLALAQSEYNNYISTRLTDNITITILLAPFLDVNIKVSYKPYNSETVNQYIIDTINHDFENGTTSITMHRFYPLYS